MPYIWEDRSVKAYANAWRSMIVPSRWKTAVEMVILLIFSAVWAATVLGATWNGNNVTTPIVLLLTTVMALLVGSIAGFRAREIVQVAEAVGIEVSISGTSENDDIGEEGNNDG